MNPPRTKILLADDHAILLDAFRKILEPAYEIVAGVTDGHAMIEAAEKFKPEIIIADISMPRLNGLDAGERIKERLPKTKLIFLTMNEDPDLALEAMRRGAAGYVLKKSAVSELLEAIRQTLANRVYISPALAQEPAAVFVSAARTTRRARGLSLRQREVLQLLAEGRSMKEAAELLHVKPRTIAFHKYSMMEQLGIKTGAELVQHAMNLGLVARKDPPRT
jgi:DNA-binding NarL/FixJ family response regulator